jgi:Fibronectin type III domain
MTHETRRVFGWKRPQTLIRATTLLVMAFAIGLVAGPSTAEASDERDQSTKRARAAQESQRIPLADTKLIIEHNATDEDTGFQVFVDGEPWNLLTIEGPDERTLLEVRPRGALRTLGLTELFFETNEPENAEVPIPELLSRFPEGKYEFEAVGVEGEVMEGSATLSHRIPAGPEILAPSEDEVVDPGKTVIRWDPVTESITGSPVDIVGYEVIVTKDTEVHPPGFSKLELSVHVTAATTSLTVPPEFFEPGTRYTFEVLALEKRGNQTISSSSFRTP